MQSPGSSSARPHGSAVLLVNGKGVIQAANPSAGLLWSEPEGALVGRPLVSLFSWDILSSDPDFLEAQWEILLSGALEHDLTLPAQPKSGEPRNVRLRLESPAGLSADSYFATVQLPVVPVVPPPAVVASTSPDGAQAFRLLAEQGGLGFFDLNLTAGSVHLSPAWKQQLGFTPAELPDTLEAYRQRVHPDDSAAAPDQVGRKARAGTRPLNVEFRLRHSEGHWIWVHCVGVQWIDDQGALARVAGVQLDISERKELEEQLVANDSRLHDLSDAGPLAAFELDLAHHTVWFSRAWEELLGFSPGELPAEPGSLARALPEQEAEEGLVSWLLGRNPGSPSFLESVTLRGKDGRRLPVILGGHRTFNRRHEPQRIVGFASSLPGGTSATTGQASSTPSAAALPSGGEPPPMCVGAYNTLAEAVILTDPSGRIGFANGSAARLLQRPAELIRGQQSAEVLQLVNRLSQRPSGDPLQRLQGSSLPLQLISDDSLSVSGGVAVVPVVWTARGLTDAAGQLLGYVIVLRNPEEMTLTPEELVRANRFESLGLLASGIAHDFNNLLTTILGAVSMAKDERDYGALADAERACDAAKNLTRQLLSFASGGGGSQVVCEMKPLLEDAIKIAAASTTARITLEADEDVAPVLGDRSQLLQIFQNLIINAQQAMPPPPHRPRIDLTARNRHLEADQIEALPAGDYVALAVTDNATGIKAEHLDRIFDAFFTTKKHGTGLGLATVLSIVRKHGGQITVESQVGAGTTFTVFLPRTHRAVAVAAPRRAALRFGSGRVLFMDDDPQIRTLTGSMLEGLGYKFDLAKDGAEAIALYKRYLNLGRPYDVVIMDITVVGGMGAEECFPELKKLDPDVRAIVASGYDSDEIERKCLQMGFLGYLKKPYRVGELGQALKSV